MTPATTIIPPSPRGAAFLGVAGLAVPITTGLRATTDHHQVIILRADIGVTQSDANLKVHWRKRMIRLISIALALAVATSAQAMSPAPLHEPVGTITQVREGCGPFRVRVNGICVARTSIRQTRRYHRRCARWSGGVCVQNY